MGHWHLPDKNLILGSKSTARAALLTQAGVSFQMEAASIDEESIRQSAEADGASPDEIAVLLAEMKGEVIAARHPESMIIASDQLLVCDGVIYGKPANLDEAKDHLQALSGKCISLLQLSYYLIMANVFGTILHDLKLPFIPYQMRLFLIICPFSVMRHAARQALII